MSTKLIHPPQVAPAAVLQVVPLVLRHTVTRRLLRNDSSRASCNPATSSLAWAANRLLLTSEVKLGTANVIRTASTASVIISSTSENPAVDASPVFKQEDLPDHDLVLPERMRYFPNGEAPH